MTSKHTATPKYSIGPIIRSDGTTRMCIYERDVGTVMLVNITDDTSSDTYGQDIASDIAKAKFIVRACNAHDDLVDLLRDISGTLAPHDPMKERILAAVSKARGA